MNTKPCHISYKAHYFPQSICKLVCFLLHITLLSVYLRNSNIMSAIILIEKEKKNLNFS